MTHAVILGATLLCYSMKYVLATFLKLKAEALSVTVVRLMWCNMNYKTLNSSYTGGVLYKIEKGSRGGVGNSLAVAALYNQLHLL